MKRPSIHQLEVFCRVVSLESMARAAEELRVAPSSVSMQIQELERRYRTRLLVRGARGTSPTAAGSALYTQATALLQGFDDVEREICRIQDDDGSGALRFAAGRTIGSGVVRQVLRTFEQERPRVDVSFFRMPSSRAATTEVLAERAEFALVGQICPKGPLAVEPLFREPLVVTVAPHHPLAGRPHLTLPDLADQVLLLREPPVLEHRRILATLAGAGVRPRIVEFGSTEAVKAAAVEGGGVAVLPGTATSDEVTAGTLRGCPVAGFSPFRTVHLTWLTRTPLSPLAETFVRLVRECGSSVHTSLNPR